MRELVLTCAMAMLGAGCVNVVSHIDEYDAGPPPKPLDAANEAEVSTGACFSGQHWTGGTTASGVHHPGLPCMGGSCHSGMTKTPMTLGGTVYLANGAHDDNECNGADGAGMAIALTDEMGVENPTVGRVQVNGVGNFYTNKPLPMTFKVKVIYMGREATPNVMLTDGNCNYCHTSAGFKGAMGRITPSP